MIETLICQVKDRFIFAPHLFSIWDNIFFGNLETIDLIAKLFMPILDHPRVKPDLLNMMVQYFTAKSRRFKLASAEQADSIITFIADTFHRIDVFFSRSGLGINTADIECLKRRIVSDTKIGYEQLIHSVIIRILHPLKSGKYVMKMRSRQLMQSCNHILSYLLDDRKRRYARLHIHGMTARLFQHGFSQISTELIVLHDLSLGLSPYGDGLTKQLVALSESLAITLTKWRQCEPESPLSVFLLPNRSTGDFPTRFGNLILPYTFQVLKERFESFCQPKRLFWIYEDNVVGIQLSVPGRIDLQLRVPLPFAIILTTLYDFGDLSVDDLLVKTGLTIRQITRMVSKSVAARFPLLALRPDGKVAFHLEAPPRTPKKIAVILALCSLQTPVLEPSSYRTHILSVLKERRALSAGDLRALTAARVHSPFRASEYSRALMALESSQYIARDPTSADHYVYVP
jgi:hypothetical protein